MKRWAVILFAAFLLCSTVAQAEYREFGFYPFTYKVPADWTYEAEGDDNKHAEPSDSASITVSLEDISAILSVESPEEYMRSMFDGMLPEAEPVYTTQDGLMIGTASKNVRLGRRDETTSVTFAIYDGIVMTALFFGTTEADSSKFDGFLTDFPKSIQIIKSN